MLLGTIGTSVAVLAVAAVGLAMLTGRLPVRRGAAVILGCFVLFAAPMVADGLASSSNERAIVATYGPPAPRYSPAVPAPAPYDPYAGASVPDRGAAAGAPPLPR